MAVHRRPVHAEGFGGLLDGVLAGVMHLPGDRGLPGGQLGAPATGTPAGAGSLHRPSRVRSLIRSASANASRHSGTTVGRPPVCGG